VKSDFKKIVMNRIKITLLLYLLVLLSVSVSAQISYTSEGINSDFERGLEFYNKEKFPAAIRYFDLFLKKGESESLTKRTDAEYYAALSALKLFNPDGERRMLLFLSGHPESQRVNEGTLTLADYFYQNKNYKKAITYYTQISRADLQKDKLPAFYFRFGYSHFMKGDPQKALALFSEIKDIDTDYTPPAIYYYSHIAYERKMYQAALEGFRRLQNDETFGSIVPFYIVQILYIQKDYENILKTAPDLLNSAGKSRAVELYRFIGDAYFNKENYKEAVGYLEKYATGAKASGREDKYQLGFCYYKNGDTDKAIKTLQDISVASDTLSQNIWYLLGDCFIKKGDRKDAQFAFGQASQMSFDSKLKEESLFNYAKLTFEISNSPFGEAIAAFQSYIELYPGSDRIEEVYNYLVTSYMKLKNYKAALISLDKIRNKDIKLEEAYQKVAFFRGLELLKNMEIESAIEMFDKSLKYEKYSLPIRVRSIYWKAEAYYRLGQYDKAIASYEDFMGIPGSTNLPEYKLIRYNLGYAQYNLKEYATALSHFKTFESEPGNSQDLIADARNRIADCYYIATNYQQALSYYDKVIDYGMVDADYAISQKGFALGLTNDQRGKVNVLTTLISKYPKSAYIPAALYERGRANIILKEMKKGESDLMTVVNDFPKSPYVPRAMVQLGLLYFETDNNPAAVTQFKKVIENFRSTPEARSALTGLKNTYVEMNEVDTYFAYVKSLEGFGDINMAEKDSLMYGSAEKLYMTGNCGKASEIFRKYLDEFQNGNFKTNALYYLADCANSNGNKDEALGYYLEIIKAPNNDFIIQSLTTAAAILFDKEDYQKAASLYEELENVSTAQENIVTALRGELRSAYQSGDAQRTINVASRIAANSKVPEELSREAVFMKGKAHYSQNENDEALAEFKKISSEVTSAEGAESKYLVAEILFKKGNLAESEKVINDFIDKNTPHQFWTARILILSADIAIRKGDKLGAQATLKALKDNYPNDTDGIIDEVRSRLDSLSTGQGTQADTTKTQSDKTETSKK
jgi:tetratricopeptide (TPR) repeat protein